MSAHGHVRGHPVTLRGATWVFDDTKQPVDETRPCARCGRAPTPEGYDACLGHIPGAVAACCGHGVAEPYVMMEDGGD